MIEVGRNAPEPIAHLSTGGPLLLIFLETDCPTCRLAIPYLNKLAAQSATVLGISQDSEPLTRQLVQQMSIQFPVEVDHDLALSRPFDPPTLPPFFLIVP